jgi:hypothetical protein
VTIEPPPRDRAGLVTHTWNPIRAARTRRKSRSVWLCWKT